MYVKHIVTSKLSDQNLNYKSNKRKSGKSNHRDKKFLNLVMISCFLPFLDK